MKILARAAGALAMMLAVTPAHSQPSQNLAACKGGPSISADAQIVGCTSLIDTNTQGDEVLAAAFYSRGVAYYTKGELDPAIADFDKAIKLKPDYAYMPLTDRGNAYRREGQFDRAIADYGEAIELKPDYATAFNQRAYAYQEEGDFGRATADLDQAIRLNPNMAAAFNNRGMADQGLGKLDQAVVDYNEALRLNPSNTTALRSRGTVYFDLGRYAEATSDFDRALKLMPGDAYSVLWLHLIHVRAHEEDARELSDAASRLDLTIWPGPVVNLFLGKLSPDEVRSKSTIGDASSVKNQACETTFYVGESALMRGDQTSAKSSFQSAIRICPKSFAEYLVALQELKRLPSDLDPTH